jgi:hypothetical protein
MGGWSQKNGLIWLNFARDYALDKQLGFGIVRA